MAEFDHWRTFVRVVECGSFSQAACHLRVAKSAVSRRVSELESDLGVTLLVRTTRCVKPTEIGHMTYVRAMKLLAEFDELESGAAGRRSSLDGLIRITAPLSFALGHMQGVFRAFQLENPNVCLDLRFSDSRADIIGEGFDFAIRVSSEIDGSFVARRLCSVNQLVVASPDYLSRNGVPHTLEDLTEHKALCYSGTRKVGVWSCWEREGIAREVQVSPVMVSDTGGVLLNSALAGDGLLCGPTSLTSNAVSDGRLIPVLTRWNWSNMAAFLVYPPDRRMPRRVRALMDSIAASFADPTPWDTAIAKQVQHAHHAVAGNDLDRGTACLEDERQPRCAA